LSHNGNFFYHNPEIIDIKGNKVFQYIFKNICIFDRGLSPLRKVY